MDTLGYCTNVLIVVPWRDALSKSVRNCKKVGHALFRELLCFTHSSSSNGQNAPLLPKEIV